MRFWAARMKRMLRKSILIWKKYNLSEEECKFVKQAVIQHSRDEWMRNGDEGYDVMAILN